MEALPPDGGPVVGGALAPAVDLGTWVGPLDAAPGLLVAAPSAAPGADAFGFAAEVSTFSGSLGLRAATCHTQECLGHVSGKHLRTCYVCHTIKAQIPEAFRI